MVATLTEKLAGVRVESAPARIDQLKIGFSANRKYGDFKSRHQANRAAHITLPDGRNMKIAPRFWNSLCSMYSMSQSTFDLFTHEEVFNRLAETRNDGQVRITAEFDKGGERGGIHGTVLSVTKTNKPLLGVDDVEALVNKYKGTRVRYSEGVITASFDCPFPTPYTIANEEYAPRYTLKMPVDGFGLPITYLEMLRLICTNGMVGMSSAFREQFHLGKNDESVAFMLDKAMSTFSAEEEFHGISKRMDVAALSWSSLQESSVAYKALKEALEADKMTLEAKTKIFDSFDKLCGHPLQFYKLTSREELSARRAAAIPTKATVYDLVTFMTEISTHKVHTQDAKDRINRWCGDVLSREFDLERSKEQYSDIGAFFIENN